MDDSQGDNIRDYLPNGCVPFQTLAVLSIIQDFEKPCNCRRTMLYCDVLSQMVLLTDGSKEPSSLASTNMYHRPSIKNT